MKKQLQSMKTKYENVVQKSNAERASMNQMLIRLETQLSEVTEMLRTKNEDVRNYEQRIQSRSRGHARFWRRICYLEIYI